MSRGYSGSIVKVTEVLEGVQDGILDIGGMCFCFEPSNLPLHAFQVMLPFGTMDPETSLKVAQEVYAEVPYLSDVFEDKFNQVPAETGLPMVAITSGPRSLGAICRTCRDRRSPVQV